MPTEDSGLAQRAIMDEYGYYVGSRARTLDKDFIQAYNPSPEIRKTIERLNVASWVADPDEATTSSSGHHPNVGP